MAAYETDHPADWVRATAHALKITDSELLPMVKDKPDFYASMLEDKYDYLQLVIHTIAPTVYERFWLHTKLSVMIQQPRGH